MHELLTAMMPEIVLCCVACVLFLVGTIATPAARKFSAFAALATLLGMFGYLLYHDAGPRQMADPSNTVIVGSLAIYIKTLAAGIGAIFVLLAWPSDATGTKNSAIEYGHETSEFFALILLSIAGLFTVASANDMILLFLGIELASIPTYIMVSISRPLSVAQEAGVKYFFLGAMSAAILLFGFSYLYGTTGLIKLNEISEVFAKTQNGYGQPTVLSGWQALALLMLLAGLAFKIAAVPMHVYAGDVYQGAATPVTAFLAFVPKTSGFVAIIKVLWVSGGASWNIPPVIATLLWIVAVLTMSAGNVLALLQFNVKRMLAYSSVAHTGYMLVGLATLASTAMPGAKQDALSAVLFYLAAYGIMNAGAFGVLMMLPARDNKPATSAETLDDLVGQGRKHVGIGLAMAVACFGLIGLPLTVGFFGKLLLVKPALDAKLYGLVIITMINAAIAAAYYLKIVAAMFLRPLPENSGARHEPLFLPVALAVGASVLGSLILGILLPVTQMLNTRTTTAASAPGITVVRTDVISAKLP